ncbi:MAG: type II toxin-antitoxin system PemK/MazF family toxin [Chloroflexi bacterium]|nr:type II toxin-antitoxin system PemK/MazF family toxin [Chloroflexota bacterium]
MEVSQGEVFWVDFGEPSGSEPGYRRRCVVVQNDVFNRSRLATVIVCALTSTLRLAARPGNISLLAGEGNLPAASIANVTQVFTVDRSALGDRIGALSRQRVREIVAGIRLVLEPREPAAD